MEDQENIGLNDEILFKILLQKMIEENKVKYHIRTENGVKRRYFWYELSSH